ncbi:MAG: ribonuclease E/G [Pseudomonadota bacterium]
MKGRVIAVEARPDGAGQMAALMEDGQLTDLLIDPPDDIALVPGQLWRGTAERPMKGQGGVFVALGGQRGYLRELRNITPGAPMLVQVSTYPEAGKAAPVTRRVALRSRYVVVTPGAEGVNASRAIKDPEEQDRLTAAVTDLVPEGVGLVVRTAARDLEAEELRADAAEVLGTATALLNDPSTAQELLLDAPGAAERAWQDWPEPDVYDDETGSFERHNVWDALDAVRGARVELETGGSFFVEATRALVAVDVNTGADSSQAATLKANIAALQALPRALRLRGLGGQIVVDIAGFSKKDRPKLEAVAKAAFKADSVETQFVGWTPLGHMELTRKRERLPLSEARLP